ncbi:hypothetical protein [Nocardia sp. AG03]|uniref:hypothetical protein n=1 Tax=Nocardia sp. AG03 TaxID=3025312 RepID=UPI0024186383|nr:hypothetical protein [Nocardia sp. AG03]
MSSHHTHTWRIESCHRTSDGLVAYQRCRCGVRRIALGDPTGISTELHGEDHRATA